MPVNNGQHALTIRVRHPHRHPMSKERTRTVELLAAQAIAVPIRLQSSLVCDHVFARTLDRRVTQPLSFQDAVKEKRLLSFSPNQTYLFDVSIVVLWDLPDGGIGLRNNRDHFRERGRRDSGSAILFGYRNSPETGLRKRFDFVDG